MAAAMPRLVAAVLTGLLALGLAGCERRPPGPLRVVVSVPPLAGLVRAIAFPGAEVTTLVPAGRSLHGYEMTAADTARLARADIVVYVGLGLEPRLEQFLKDHPSRTRRAVCFADVAGIKGDDGHSHEPGEEHDLDHDEHAVDPHLWLDPSLVEKLIPALGRAVIDANGGDPLLELAARADEALGRVRDIDGEYRRALEPFADAALVTHHNAFERLADRYGLRIAAVIRPSESVEPTPGQIEAAVAAIREHGARAVISEPQYDPAAAQRVAQAAGVPVTVLDVEGGADWFALMRENLESLTRALGGGH